MVVAVKTDARRHRRNCSQYLYLIDAKCWD